MDQDNPEFKKLAFTAPGPKNSFAPLKRRDYGDGKWIGMEMLSACTGRKYFNPLPPDFGKDGIFFRDNGDAVLESAGGVGLDEQFTPRLQCFMCGLVFWLGEGDFYLTIFCVQM